MSQAVSTGKKRNGALCIYRFLFSVVIALFHLRDRGAFGDAPTAFHGGYLAVEFFFIVAGYFLMQDIERDAACETPVSARVFSYARKRFLRLFFPYALAQLSIGIIRVIILQNMSWKSYLIGSVFEALFLQAFGFPYTVFIFWFVSALLIASVFLYWIAQVLKENFPVCLAFASPVIIAALYQKYGHMDLTMGYGFLIGAGIWRAIAELGLGCLIYRLVKYMKGLSWRPPKSLATGFELILLSFILFIMFRTNKDVKDFPMIILIGLLVICTFLEYSYISKWFDNPLCGYLNDISYGFYLNQRILTPFFPKLSGAEYWFCALLFLWLNFILSACSHAVCKKTPAMFNRNLQV